MQRWRNVFKRVELRIPLTYAIISVCYILFSDLLVSVFFSNTSFIIKAQMIKGWAFVLGTSLLIFMLLKKAIMKYESVDREKADLIIQLQKESKKKDEVNRLLENVKYELEKALITANESKRIKEEFLSLMSHEIRTPLTGIIGFSELAFQEMGKHPQLLQSTNIRQDIEFIHKSAIRLNEILSNLITLSETSSGGEIKVEYKEFDIRALVENILTLYQDRNIKNSNKVEMNFSSETNILSDPVRLQIILLNLIGNAIKFTSQGQIKIIFTEQSNFYQFEIQDTGIGIEEKRQREIFDEFKQLEDTVNKRRYQGGGLGLAVCKKLLAALKGEIWLKSISGQGSSFFIRISIPGKA